MKLYNKPLNGVEALKREKARLKVLKSFSKASDLMPVKEVKKGSSSGILGALMGAATAKGGAGQIMAIAGPLLTMLRKRRAKSKAAAFVSGTSDKAKPSFLKRAAVEIIGGYIRWKAIEMSYNGLQIIFRGRKRRQEQKMKMKMH